MAIKERRAFQRIPLDGRVSIRSANKRPRMLTAFLDNLSFGGFGMYSQDKVEVTKEIEFDLTVPLLGQSLPGRGSVRYSNPVQKYDKDIYFMGVEFNEVNKDAIMFIIKRLHLQKAKGASLKPHNFTLDFIPY